jgi:uncharacterized protein YraI
MKHVKPLTKRPIVAEEPAGSDTTSRLRPLGKLATVVGVTVGSLLVAAAPALAATGTVQTGGPVLTVRSGPGNSSSAVRTVANGSSVQIICQAHGSSVAGNWGSTDLWDQIAGGGYVTDGFVYSGSDGMVAPPCGANSRADQAINWYQAKFGDTSYHMRCETAVENAYGTSGRYTSALANWNTAVSQGRAHRGDLQAPRGALVFWDITEPYGHVGISRGDGTFVATDVNGTAIGAASLPHYSNYLGWANPDF